MAKKALKNPKIITIPNPNDQLILVSDGCNSPATVGSTLYIKRGPDFHIAGFFSAKVKKNQIMWLPCEIEALGINLSVNAFKNFIQASKHETEFLTDSKACVGAFWKLSIGGFSLSPRISSFLMNLNSVNVTIEHIIDLQKAFDTVDHTILKKLDHYGIRGVANKWFKSYLSNRKQFVSINGVNSDLQTMKFGVPRGSVLGPLLFLIYINDLNSTIKFCTTRHFADDTNLLIKNNSLKQIKKYLNFDLRNLVSWLKANKISLNASKTEILIFRHPNKPINYDLNNKLDGKRIYPSKFVKYLGILIDPHLSWNYHSKMLAPKLSRAVGMLAKIRHFVTTENLRNIYFGIFSYLLNYGAQVWGQHHNCHIKRIIKLQDKAIRIINYAHYRESTSQLYKNSKILKFKDNITLNNYIYVHDSFTGRLPLVLADNFKYLHDFHDHNTRQAALRCVKLAISRTLKYGIHSVTGQSARAWNYLQINCSFNMYFSPRKICKKIISQFFLNNYSSSSSSSFV